MYNTIMHRQSDLLITITNDNQEGCMILWHKLLCNSVCHPELLAAPIFAAIYSAEAGL